MWDLLWKSVSYKNSLVKLNQRFCAHGQLPARPPCEYGTTPDRLPLEQMQPRRELAAWHLLCFGNI